MEDNVKRVIARPFSGSHEKMVEYLGIGFKADVGETEKWLEHEPDSIEKEVLLYQLERYKGIIG